MYLCKCAPWRVWMCVDVCGCGRCVRVWRYHELTHCIGLCRTLYNPMLCSLRCGTSAYLLSWRAIPGWWRCLKCWQAYTRTSWRSTKTLNPGATAMPRSACQGYKPRWRDFLGYAHHHYISLSRARDFGVGGMCLTSFTAQASHTAKGNPSHDERDDAQIVQAVRQQLVRKRAKFKSRVSQLVAEALVVTRDRTLRVTTELAGAYGHLHYDNRTSLADLLAALDIAGE